MFSLQHFIAPSSNLMPGLHSRGTREAIRVVMLKTAEKKEFDQLLGLRSTPKMVETHNMSTLGSTRLRNTIELTVHTCCYWVLDLL